MIKLNMLTDYTLPIMLKLHDKMDVLQEKMDEEEFTLVKIHTDDNGSDMLTKNLPMDRLRVCRQRSGLADSFPQE